MTQFALWAKTKTQSEADIRDRKVWDVLPVPTPNDLNTLPASYSWESNIWVTENQGNIGSCTALGTTHSLQIQSITDLTATYPDQSKTIYGKLATGDNIVDLSWQDLWTKMWHDPKNPADSGDYVENAIKTVVKQGELGKDITNQNRNYKADGFAYITFDSTEAGMRNLKFQLTRSPLIMVIGGNDTTWNELQMGELETVIPKNKWNWQHCICCDGYDDGEQKFHVLNSWTPNDTLGKISSFKLSYNNFRLMLAADQINRRCWRMFSADNATVDLLWFKRRTEAMTLMRAAKKMFADGTVADQKYLSKVALGKYFEAAYWFTDSDL